MKIVSVITIFMITIAGSKFVNASAIESNIPEYQTIQGLKGELSSIGSDTLANLMTYWSRQFTQRYPDVKFSIQAAGSSTAPSGLIEKVANFGPMSRQMKTKEQVGFENKFGYKPLAIPVAIDALAVYVNKDNPIKGLTIHQVDAIFSSDKKCGYEGNISTWGDVGVSGTWSNKIIQLYGRNSISGTYGFFRKHALCKGQYKTTVNEQAGLAVVVEKVSEKIDSIGYSGIGYKTTGVRVVTLRQALPVLEKEFLKLVLSKQGQQSVIRDGYIALPAKVVAKALRENWGAKQPLKPPHLSL